MSNIKITIIMISLILFSCQTTAPLPSSITMYTPRDDVPTNVSAFSGIWAGRWYGAVDMFLVVYYIDNYRAEVIYSKGWISHYSPDPYQGSLTFTVDKDIPSIHWTDYDFNEYHFVIDSDSGEMKGYFIEKSTGSKGVAYMRRVKDEELPNVKVSYKTLP